MSYRLVNIADKKYIRCALLALQQASPSYGYSKAPDWRKGMELMRDAYARGNAYIVDNTYLLLVSEGQAWHGDDTCLEEVLVLRVYNDTASSVGAITTTLEAIAKEREVDCIITHDSSLNQRMGNLYKRAGYRSITTTYYKEVNNGPVD